MILHFAIRTQLLILQTQAFLGQQEFYGAIGATAPTTIDTAPAYFKYSMANSKSKDGVALTDLLRGKNSRLRGQKKNIFAVSAVSESDTCSRCIFRLFIHASNPRVIHSYELLKFPCLNE